MELFENHDTDPGPEGPERSDDEIRQEIEELYSANEYLKNRNIKVSVKDCRVTLEGSVFTPQSWELASTLAVNVWGVEEVNNHIQVTSGPGNPIQ